uniref:Putative response regulator receiver modulated CheW protein n=1 Tax=Magnetococcus massalia (strain MO-1) TaxID=451514 RepID=A0A1S7LF05_MAGMO|nr:Putative response regulator receiver modulated CheW protein [Candidatus Magnetococcus massalia]
MSEWMDEVSQRANLALSNQMEMLTFYLSDEQLYGINVFKIIEVIESPKTITHVPGTNPAVIGTMRFREQGVTVIDLSAALGMPHQERENVFSYIIVCEYNNTTQGLLINRPNVLLTRSWSDVSDPGSLSSAAYLTATAYSDEGVTIQILDVEKILEEVLQIERRLSNDLAERMQSLNLRGKKVIIADDSSAARSLLHDALATQSIEHEIFSNAEDALTELQRDYAANNKTSYALVLSDIEMPGMDGFTLTRTLKADENLGHLPVVLHSSMSNPSNRAMAQQVGADDFVGKFNPDGLADVLLKHLE